MTIQQNIAKANQLREQVKAHCMCLRLEEDENQIMIVYPEGDFEVQGLRLRNMPKAVAFEKALAKMENHWKQSLPGHVWSE